MKFDISPWPSFTLMLACATGSSPPAAREAPVGASSLRAPEPLPASEGALAGMFAPDAAREVVAFWRQAGPSLWFAKDPEFDRRFRERFGSLYAAAAAGQLLDWTATPEGALGLILLLDQYPRNSFRGSARMYATDALARQRADAAIRAGHDRRVPPELALFIYLPFGHSEALSDQERCVELARRIGPPHVGHAEHHRDIVRRFGRFPHRNAILGRVSTPDEQRYLEQGGYQG